MLLMSLISMHAANLTSPPISIVPRPAQVVPGEGNFTFSSQTLFSVENHEQAVIVRNFINLLKRSSGITPQLAIGGSEKSHVCFTTDSSLKSEAYQLAVTPEQIQVKASDIKGFSMHYRPSAYCCRRLLKAINRLRISDGVSPQ